jgi:PST family polysaccharide transporter
MAVCAAIAGWGVYSLVSQSIVTAIVTTAGLWTVSKWRPGTLWSVAQIRELAGFSGNLVGYNTFNYFARNVDSLLVGRFLGSTELGYYNMAYRLMLWPLQNISSVVGRALFPALSRVQNDKERLARGYIRATAAVFLVTAPLTLGLFVLREPFVVVALGEGWGTVAELLFWLAPVATLQAVGTTVGPLYLATGRTDVMFKWGVFAGLFAICAFVVGLQWGLQGMVAAYFVASVFLFWPSLAVPFRLIGLRVTSALRPLVPTLFAASIMALLVELAAMHSSEIAMAGWVRLTVLTAWGAVSYIAISLIVQRPFMKDVMAAVSGR